MFDDILLPKFPTVSALIDWSDMKFEQRDKPET